MSRLVEYVIIVGSNHPKVDSTQPPELLRRFPGEDHKNFPLPVDVVFFCQPEACVTASQKISLRETNSFVFTLTDKETGITRYGICCNFFRPCIGYSSSKRRLSRAYSTDSYEERNDQALAEVSEQRDALSRTSSVPSKSSMKNSVPLQKSSSQSLLCYSLTSLCIVSCFPFFSTFRECLFVLRKLIESQGWNRELEKHLRLQYISHKSDRNQNYGKLPLVECRNWAAILHNDTLKSAVNMEMLEIDKWISNLLRIPQPIAGANRVEVELLPRHVQPPLTFALPEKSRFSFLDYPIHLPFELLGVETCLKILTSIVLEQKVVLQSRDYNALSISVMALTSMLYPLQYMFPIIPLLPTCMKNAEQLLLAPTPYVIGVPSSFFRVKGMSFQVPHDVLVVDLDTNKMSVPLSMDEIPALPEPDGSILKEQLKQCLACLSFSPQPIHNLDALPPMQRPHADSISGSNLTSVIYGNDIDSVDVAVRASLVKFFCSPNVLGSFVQHARILRLYPRPVVALQKESLIKSRPASSDFIRMLAYTQAVEFYAEWMVNPDNTVFRKVENGILDPRVIGDKPRWYTHYVQPLYFQVHNPHSRLGFDLYMESDSESDGEHEVPTIQEEDEDVLADMELQLLSSQDDCSCCSSAGDSSDDSSLEQRCDGTFVEKHRSACRKLNQEISEMFDSSYSAFQAEGSGEYDVVSHPALVTQNSVYNSIPFSLSFRTEGRFSQNPISDTTEIATVTDILSNVNKKPMRLVNPEIPSMPEKNTDEDLIKKTLLRQSNSTASAKLSALLGNIKPKLQSKLSTDSNGSVVSQHSVLEQAWSTSENTTRQSAIVFKWPSIAQSQVEAVARIDKKYESSHVGPPLMREISRDMKVYNSENQQLVTEVVDGVKNGDGVGWLSQKKVRRLMLHEGLRQYLINQLDQEHTNKGITLNDSHIPRNVYRGYLDLMKMVVEGYEHTMLQKGVGGLSSVFPFLEVAHRYFCGKTYQDDSHELGSSSNDSSSQNSLHEGIVADSSTELGSDSSLHFHKDSPQLANVRKVQSGDADSLALSHGSFVMLDSGSSLTIERVSTEATSSTGSPALSMRQLPEPSALTHAALRNSTPSVHSGLSSSRKSSLTSSETTIGGDLYLVVKSNSSAGFRFYNGKRHKATAEPAGRGVSGTGRRYLYEGLLRQRCNLWDDTDFWEYCFLDSVAAEREAAGMDVNPVDLINRYRALSPVEQKILEEDEDNLLGLLLHNMTAFMLMMNVEKKVIRRKVRRLLGKSHIGLTQTQSIDCVLDNLDKLNGNDVDLILPKSRQLKIQIFVVHLGDTQTGPVFFLEVRDDCMVLKSTNGSVVERWWYESVVNLSCSPKTKVLCLWIRVDNVTDMQKICTKKCKTLYSAVKKSMQKAAERLNKDGEGVDLERDFSVVELISGEVGVLKVSLEGISIIFVDKKIAIDLRNLKNCSAKEKNLVIEEYIPHNQGVIEHHFVTDKANEICYAILCLFSYMAATKSSSPDYRFADQALTM